MNAAIQILFATLPLQTLGVETYSASIAMFIAGINSH